MFHRKFAADTKIELCKGAQPFGVPWPRDRQDDAFFFFVFILPYFGRINFIIHARRWPTRMNTDGDTHFPGPPLPGEAGLQCMPLVPAAVFIGAIDPVAGLRPRVTDPPVKFFTAAVFQGRFDTVGTG